MNTKIKTYLESNNIMTKKIVRVYGAETAILSYADFKEELKFQIAEDYCTYEEYEEYIQESDEFISEEDFFELKFNNYLAIISNGYSIEIMGDSYYFQ